MGRRDQGGEHPRQLTRMASPQTGTLPVASDDALALLRSRSLASVIGERIERMILEGELSPGQRVNELALAQALGVSRSPVREAWRKLEQAGMLEIVTNRGMFVRRVDLERAIEIYDIRAALAQLAGSLLAERASAAEIQSLAAMAKAMEAAARSGDTAGYYRRNLAFHQRLVECTRNVRLLELFQGTDKELHLYRHNSLAKRAAMQASNREHRDIVDAVRRRDAAAAGSAFKRHVLNGRDRALAAAKARSEAT